MAGANATRGADVGAASASLFDAIGAFMTQHRLSPDPRHYAFVHDMLTHPDGVVAQSVATLTEGGFRLSARDIEALGGEIGDTVTPDIEAAAEAAAATDGLVAQTQMQVESFTDMVATMRAEAQDFGRDLAASAIAIERADGGFGRTGTSDTEPDDTGLGIADVVRLTRDMLGRVHDAEQRLESATHEAADLRTKLELARGDAMRDPLTGLPNRRALEERFAAAQVEDARLCLAICDIDHFKSVNDRFGHVVGDRVLKAISAALVEACPGHFIARYGGEEFVVLFSGIEPDAAGVILDDARQAVATRRFRLRETDALLGAVTFSAGMTEAVEDEVLGTVFARADKLLYAAKNAGRNILRAA